MVKEKIGGILKRIEWKYLVLFLIYFILQLKAINQNYFDSDEFDIFVGGEAIWRGAWLYRDFFSQHMPFSYYISAVFWLLGATSVLLQRIYFYVMFSAIWVFIIKRYSKIVNQKCLIIYPVIFIFLINCYDMGTSILSEHLNAIGAVLLLLEYRMFSLNEKNKISLSSCIIISASILLTFGTTFVSAFLIFAVVLMVIFSEFRIIRTHGIKGKELFNYLRGKYTLLIVCCVAPWLLLCIIYLAAGVLDDFYYGAYYLNREIYPAYLGGYGDDILSAIYGGVPEIAGYFGNTLSGLFNNSFEMSNFILLLSLCIAVGYIIYHIVEKDKKEGLLWILMLVESATRGVFNFHSTHFVALIAMICAICFFDTKPAQEKSRKTSIVNSVKYGLVCILSVVYVSDTSAFFTINLSSEKSETAIMLEKILSEDEGVWCCQLANNYVYIESGRYPYKTLAVPWFWDAYGQQMLDEFGDEPPRVCILNDNLEVWGHNVNDYAPGLISYVNEHYTKYSDMLYIRNDYYNEAVNKIEADTLHVSVVTQDNYETVELTLENADEEYTQVFFPVWSEADGQDDIIWYPAKQVDTYRWSCKVKVSDHHSFGKYDVHVYVASEQNNESHFLIGKSFLVPEKS